jgi:hypothetical protein
MRFIAPILLAAVFVAGVAHAQPSGTSTYTPTALQPNNCGTPDTPKACPGSKSMSMSKHHTAYKAAPKQ